MSLQEAVAALPSGGGASHELLRALLMGRLLHFIDDDTDPQTEDPVDGESGEIVPFVAWQEQIYWHRPESVADHDGASVLVLQGGKRYAVAGLDFNIGWVLSNTVTVPPDPLDEDEEARPSHGDSYLIPDGAEGPWSTKAKYRAIWTGEHEWKYVAPRPGVIVWVAGVDGGQDTPWHYDSVIGDWVVGFGDNALTAGSVRMSHLNVTARRDWTVQCQTLESVPEPIVANVAYVIGADPDEDTVLEGQSFKVAVSYDGETLTVETPREGDTIYDLSLSNTFEWNGEAWQTKAAASAESVILLTTAQTLDWEKPDRLIGLRVFLLAGGGGGGGGPSGSHGQDGQSSFFGAHMVAPGGAGGLSSASGGGAGGGAVTGTAGGIVSVPGSAGANGDGVSSAGAGGQAGSRNLIPLSPGSAAGNGGAGSASGGRKGGGGGSFGWCWIPAADLAAVEQVRVGAGGNGGSGGAAGSPGVVMIVEVTRA